MALNENSGKDEEYKVKVIALRTTSNIHSLIKVGWSIYRFRIFFTTQTAVSHHLITFKKEICH